MPSTFTTNLGIELPADGELDGVWGDVVNENMQILDRAVNGSVALTLSGTTSTLTTTDGTLSDGQYKVLVLSGSLAATHTITISPNDAQKVYYVYNTTAQSVVFTQGSGGNVTIASGDSGIIYATGSGASSAVVNLTDHFAMSSVKITGGDISGATITSGSISGTSVTTASATITGGTITGITDLTVADGGTGRSTLASGALLLGAGTGGVNTLSGTAVGQIPQWNGTTWGTGSLPSSGVTSVTASSPLSSSGGATPNITFSGTLAIGSGGTGATSAATALSNLGGQPLDSDLTAIAGLSTTGIIARTGTGTAAARTISQGTGISVSNGTGASGNPTISAVIASTAEAQAGTSDTVLMTPLRTAAAITAQAGSVFLDIMPVSGGGSSYTISGLALSQYTTLYIVISGVSTTGSGGHLRFSTNSNYRITADAAGTGNYWFGHVIVDISSGIFSAVVGEGTSSSASALANDGYAGPSGITPASTSITISLSANNFDAGAITIYGVR